MKFCILKKVMSGSLQNIIRKIAACATLHNFIIAEDGVQEMEEVEDPASARENQTTTPLERIIIQLYQMKMFSWVLQVSPIPEMHC